MAGGIEVGALSLPLRSEGLGGVLSDLGAVETRAKKVGATPATVKIEAQGTAQASAGIAGVGLTATQAAGALKTLGIDAKVVGGAVAVASGEMASATAIVKGLGASVAVVDAAEAKLAATSRAAAAGVETLTAAETRATGATRTYEGALRGAAAAGGAAAAASRGIATSASGFTPTGQRAANAALAMAFGFDAIARSGGEAGGAIQTVLRAGSNMALLLGPKGLIVGAVASAALAIYEIFNRTRKEIEATTKTAREELDKLQNAGDVAGLIAEAQRLEQGTAASGFADGLKALREEAAKLNAQVATAERQRNPFGLTRLRREAEEATAKVTALEAKLADIQRRVMAPGPRTTLTGTLAGVSVTGGAEDETEQKRQEAQAKEVQALVRISDLHAVQIGDVQRATALEAAMTAELERGRVSLERRATLVQQLAALRETALPGMATSVTAPAPTALPRSTPEVLPGFDAVTAQVEAQRIQFEDEATDLAEGLGETLRASFADNIAEGLADGIAAGFGALFASGSLASGFSALGKALAGGIGSAMVTLGKGVLLMSKLMAAAKHALSTLNPVAGAVAGVLLIAAGAALQAAAGASFGGRGSDGSAGGIGGGLGSAYTASAPTPSVTLGSGYGNGAGRATTPSMLVGQSAPVAAPTPVHIASVTVLSPSDPTWQRQLSESVTLGVRRGLSYGGA